MTTGPNKVNNYSTFSDDTFSSHIQTTILKPAYERDIEDFSNSRYTCRKYGYCFEVCGKILTGISTLTTFISASGIGDAQIIGLIAGCIGVCAMSFQHLGSFTLNRSRENTEQLNHTLTSLGININIPDVVIDEKDDK